MDTNLVMPAVTTAISVGLGCGACCSPVISVFLSTYVISHSNSVIKGVLSFVSFFAGKIISVSCMCMIAAFIGRQFVGTDGFVGSFNLRLAAQLMMSGIGLLLALKWIWENSRKSKCANCRECNEQKMKAGILPMFTAGLTYGFTPCAPLLLMLGYAFSLPVYAAGITGGTFGLASAVSPVLLLVLISGALSKRLISEIPQYLKWFRLASYVLLMVMPFIITPR